ncbi:undecaprenyl-diphosphate phosphatase [Cellvibrio sp. ARAG 10.3]|uniref:undecaprenyl-diphosphate phosphatase n=1 Tax=Cellvibrio sp. ARAG 10.3 TaxID=3451358 RepID=UPI003F44749C
MDLIQAVVLALVQGLTEFLPVSSSAHLLLVPIFADWPDQGLAFDVALHVGSLTAVMIYFRHDIKRMYYAWLASITRRESSEDSRLAWAVIVGTIPVCIAGFFLKDLVATAMRSPLVSAFGLIAFGLLLAWADWRHRGSRSEYQMNKWDVFWVGCAQALALIPGTSRSGITITAALMLGFTREAAARFSFLLSIPVIIIAGAVETNELVHAQVAVDWTAMIVGTLVSGISAYLCIYYFLAFISRIGMQPFVVYRIALGIFLIVLYWNPTP